VLFRSKLELVSIFYHKHHITPTSIPLIYFSIGSNQPRTKHERA